MTDPDKFSGLMLQDHIPKHWRYCWCLEVVCYCTGKCWSNPLRSKAESYGAARALITKMENADHPPEGIEIHNSDHVGEVIASKDFKEWLGQ